MGSTHSWAIIYLDDTSPCRSGSLPGIMRRRAASCRSKTDLSLLGLAPDGGYLAAHITMGAGGLLHHLFTITCSWGDRLSVSVALIRQVGSFQSDPAPVISRRRALWSADFPRLVRTSRDRPISLKRFHHTFSSLNRQQSSKYFLEINYEICHPPMVTKRIE